MEANKTHRFTLDNIFNVKDRGMRLTYTLGINSSSILIILQWHW